MDCLLTTRVMPSFKELAKLAFSESVASIFSFVFSAGKTTPVSYVVLLLLIAVMMFVESLGVP